MATIATAAILASALVIGGQAWDRAHVHKGGPLVTVYKDPDCACCNKWIDHLEQHGFAVERRQELKQAERQAALGVPESLRACHTAVVDGYVIEGHVPASDIQRLLRERPKARGLAVPEMPVGSPGMEQGDRLEAYDVLLFDETGQTVYAHHGPSPP